jgi:hypothetical protein
MRRRRSNRRCRGFGAACALACFAAVAFSSRVAAAQGAVAQEGALFLLAPIGARAVGMGQAVSASDLGSEAIWWNPAGIARMTRTEVAVNYSQTVIATGSAVDVVVPVGRAGAVAAAVYLFDPGQQSVTDPNGATVGSINPRSVVIAASYAATFGSRFNAGVTYKHVEDMLDCSGSCTVPSYAVSTTAFDFGMQGIADAAKRLTLAFAVTNLGFRLQVIDAPQADPLPTRVHLAAQYAIPAVERMVTGGVLKIGAELVDNLSLGNSSLRLGGEFAYKQQYFLRAGLLDGSGDGSRSTVGFGVQRGGIAMDFAQAFGGFSSAAGKSPTYVTLRFRF